MPSFRGLKTIVFDFDGTIAGMNIDFVEMRRRVLGHLRGFRIDPDGLRDLYVLEMIAAGKERIASSFPGRETSYERGALALVRDMEVAAARRGALFSGIREALSLLKAQGRHTGIVTRNCREAVAEIFPDIGSFVDVVLTRDDTPHVKPHPGHLQQALAALGTPAVSAAPSASAKMGALMVSAAMVGDHRMDMCLAKEVGVLAIGVLTGHDSARKLREAGADVILASASDLADLLASS